MTEPVNGVPQAVDLDETAREIQRLAAAIPHAQELPQPSAKPFDQKSHDLLIKSIDQVAADWVKELVHVRNNSEQVEQLVLERAAKVRADITQLFLLGSAALAEARRGDEVNAKLAGELENLSDNF